MYKTTSELLADRLKHIKFDQKFYKQLKAFRMAWMQKSDDYIEFLGGNSLGVQPVRFSTRDDEMLMVDLLGVDIADIRTELRQIPELYTDKYMKKYMNVAGNAIYQTLMYIVHRFIKSRDIGSLRDEAIKETYLIFSYKVIGSLVSHYFSNYNSTPEVAKAAYERLSNRYLIKKLDTWQALFEYRAKDITPPKGLHSDRIKTYNTEDSIRIINDAQGRVRDVVKNIFEIIMQIKDEDLKLDSTSLIQGTEEGDMTLGITERPDKYITYLRGIVGNPNSFIDDDLIHLLTNIIPNLDKQSLKSTLTYLSEHIDVKSEDEDDYIYLSVIKSIEYNRSKGIVSDYRTNIISMLKNMKGYWSSSSVKDKDTKHIKKYLNKITKKAIDRKTSWILTTTVIGVLLYVFLRAVSKK